MEPGGQFRRNCDSPEDSVRLHLSKCQSNHELVHRTTGHSQADEAVGVQRLRAFSKQRTNDGVVADQQSVFVVLWWKTTATANRLIIAFGHQEPFLFVDGHSLLTTFTTSLVNLSITQTVSVFYFYTFLFFLNFYLPSLFLLLILLLDWFESTKLCKCSTHKIFTIFLYFYTLILRILFLISFLQFYLTFLQNVLMNFLLVAILHSKASNEWIKQSSFEKKLIFFYYLVRLVASFFVVNFFLYFLFCNFLHSNETEFYIFILSLLLLHYITFYISFLFYYQNYVSLPFWETCPREFYITLYE